MTSIAAMMQVRPDRLIMTIVFGGALIAGWALLPGENERVAMLERDGHSREALAILEQAISGGDRRYRTLHEILGLYESEGNVAKAQSVLEAMARERPREVALKRRLAQFYKNNQKEPEYLATLQEIVDLRYSESICREWIARLRFKGNAVAEQAALQRCRQKGYRRPDDLSRLAEFVAADGDTAQAATLLKSIDDLKRLKTTRERYQLLQMLVEQDQPREAERRALKWIKSTHDDGMAIGLIDILARSKYPDSAIEVAKDAGSPGDSISLTVAERLLEKAQNGPALLYLRGWLEQAKTVAPDTAIRFVDAALAAGDPRLALRAARQFGFVLFSERALLALAAALEQMPAPAEADEVRTALAGGAPVVAEPRPAAAPGLGADAQQGQPANDAKPSAPASPRIRSVLLVDPLEIWRRSLYANMTSDAQRRMQALFVGPKPPPGYAGLHAYPGGRGRDSRFEHQHGSTRLLKKTSRVLQRAKKIASLRAKGRLTKPPAAGQQQNGPPVPGVPGGKALSKGLFDP